MTDRIIYVSKKVKPLPPEKRTIPELVIGNDYYYCTGNNNVRKGKLIGFLEPDQYGIRVVIERIKPKIYKTARKNHPLICANKFLYTDEIGATPEQAVQNW